MKHEGFALAIIHFAAEPSLFFVSKLYFDGSLTIDWRSPPYVNFYIQRRTQHALNHLIFLNSVHALTLQTMMHLENIPMTNAMNSFLEHLGITSDDSDDDHPFHQVE
jgi:hypothetical protein